MTSHLVWFEPFGKPWTSSSWQSIVTTLKNTPDSVLTLVPNSLTKTTVQNQLIKTFPSESFWVMTFHEWVLSITALFDPLSAADSFLVFKTCLASLSKQEIPLGTQKQLWQLIEEIPTYKKRPHFEPINQRLQTLKLPSIETLLEAYSNTLSTQQLPHKNLLFTQIPEFPPHLNTIIWVGFENLTELEKTWIKTHILERYSTLWSVMFQPGLLHYEGTQDLAEWLQGLPDVQIKNGEITPINGYDLNLSTRSFLSCKDEIQWHLNYFYTQHAHLTWHDMALIMPQTPEYTLAIFELSDPFKIPISELKLHLKYLPTVQHWLRWVDSSPYDKVLWSSCVQSLFPFLSAEKKQAFYMASEQLYSAKPQQFMEAIRHMWALFIAEHPCNEDLAARIDTLFDSFDFLQEQLHLRLPNTPLSCFKQYLDEESMTLKHPAGITLVSPLYSGQLEKPLIAAIGLQHSSWRHTRNLNAFISDTWAQHNELPCYSDFKAQAYTRFLKMAHQSTHSLLFSYVPSDDSEPTWQYEELSRFWARPFSETATQISINSSAPTEALPEPNFHTPEALVQNWLASKNYELSPSMLESYQLCPHRFFFDTLLKLNKEQTEKEPIPASLWGQVIHKMLELYYKELSEKKQLIARTNPQSFVKESLKKAALEALKMFKGSSGYWTLKQELLEGYPSKTGLLDAFLEEDAAFPIGGQPIAFEHKASLLHYDTAPHPFALKGTLDAVWQLDDMIVVVDYKTSKTLPEPSEILKLRSLQMAWYLKMAQHDFPKATHFVGLIHHIKNPLHIEKRILCATPNAPLDKLGAIESKKHAILDDAFWVNWIQHIHMLYSKLNEAQFGWELYDWLPHTKSKRNETCRYCNYAGICGYGGA